MMKQFGIARVREKVITANNKFPRSAIAFACSIIFLFALHQKSIKPSHTSYFLVKLPDRTESLNLQLPFSIHPSTELAYLYIY